MGKGINFGSGNSVWITGNGVKWKQETNKYHTGWFSLWNSVANRIVINVDEWGNLIDGGNYYFIKSLHYYNGNKIYCTGIVRFGIKDFEVLSLTSTTDNGDETFATDVPPKFIFIQEINTDTKLKISAIDYDNKTFTITRDDASGEEITFNAFVIN